ncbi:MAG: universal stress protein [Phenylobacterium sp.]|uniref:universal stress protein n=1 Tax=Phenylobacterium sp. TaxID=1871053 RepID=UPI0025E344E5|nr:universal stress protein [Phenylobacterium sp.]MBI1199227.1 universal stress protein [Phenylobacterium sp.]
MTSTKDQVALQTKAAASGPAIASLLVHAEPAARATTRVHAAAVLARDLGARLIGLGAETFDPTPTVDPFFGYAAGEWVSLVQEQINADLKAAEAAFRRDAAGADVEWRSVQAFPARAMASVARAADLIVASPRSRLGPSLCADPAELVMHAGRPVLIVPEGGAAPKGRAVVVAWKDTREARRAVADAMPFLARAKDVIVAAVCDDDAIEEARFQAEDVAASLQRHGVAARAHVSTSAPEGVAQELAKIAGANGADLIACGAYGHNRVAEWAFGGVTDELIHRPPCCVLLSH